LLGSVLPISVGFLLAGAWSDPWGPPICMVCDRALRFRGSCTGQARNRAAQGPVEVTGTPGEWEPTYALSEDREWVVVGWHREARPSSFGRR
jgi:hypothetical protein